MKQVETTFASLSERRVDLGQSWTQIGRDIANAAINTLEVKSDTESDCPRLYKGQSFIAGSLGRRTQEQPLDDVDVYVVLEAPNVIGVTDGSIYPLTSQFTRTDTPLTQAMSLRDGANFSSDRVLSRFAGHLASWFPNLQTGKGHAKKTCFVRFNSVNVDLSPVIWFKSQGGDIDEYWMPAGGGVPHWRRTNPKEDQRYLTRANQSHDGSLLRLIRMMKWWNSTVNEDRLKGIHLEAMIVEVLRNVTVVGYANPLRWIFSSLPSALDIACPDPTGLGDPLDSSMSENDRLMSKVTLLGASISANAAASAAARNDVDGCVTHWRSVFPDLS